MRLPWRRDVRRDIRWALAVTLLVGSAACSVILSRDATQCAADADCARFGSHPYCRGGVCVSSGLGPAACVYVAPGATATPSSDLLNQCSTAACYGFDDCGRLGVCADSGPPLAPPPQTEAAAGTTVAVDAGALPMCLDAANGRPNVVFIGGSSTWPPVIAKLAPLVLAAGGPTPVFQVTSSCAAVGSVFNGTPMTDPSPGSALSKYAAYYRSDGTSGPCLLGAGGVPADVGASDVYSTSCGFPAVGGSTEDTTGAVQAIAFIVPGDSQETAISSEAAREVFGSGGHDGGAWPWVDPSRYFVRNATAGSQQMVARAIGVPADQFWGTDQGTASNLVNAIKLLTMSAAAEPAIGFVSVISYDPTRPGNVTALAFKATGQDCSYLPDSSSQSFDKANVRDGHYPIWGPIHFLTTFPASMAASAFLNIVAVPKPPAPVLDAFIGSSLVPTCAMRVQRATELGPLSTYSPPFDCGCYFESKVGAASSDCAACDGSHPCPSDRPDCNLGYCEIR